MILRLGTTDTFHVETTLHRYEITALAPCYSQLGIATHYVPSRSIPQLLDRLSRLEHANHSIIDTALEEFYEAPSADAVPPRLVGRVRQALDHAFSADSVQEIVGRLKTIVERTGGEGTTEPDGKWAQETLSTLAARSPTSLAVAYEANRRGRHLTLRNAFEMEMKIAKAYCVSLHLVFFFSFTSLPGEATRFVVICLRENPLERDLGWCRRLGLKKTICTASGCKRNKV